MENNLKKQLREGKSILGTMITVVDNPDIARIIKNCGFDFFLIDCEHGNYDFSAITAIFAVAREAQIPAMIRIPEVNRAWVLKSMEMGAQGILLPNTETVEQAKELVAHSKYAPLGNRGVSLMRTHAGFKKQDARAYMDKVNEETFLIAQIESPVGVENLDKILDVEGIDAAFVGPNDLSQSLEIMGQFDNPKFIKAMESIIETAKKKNKFSGVHMMSVDGVQKWKQKGMMLNMWSNDINMMMGYANEYIEEVKK